MGRVTWHQFRHIHSSLLNDLRVPVKIAQEQLGHASIQTTLNIYTHVVDASDRQAIEAVERQLFPTVPKSEEAERAPKSTSAGRLAGESWRRRPDLNRGWRFCRPLPYHLATAPIEERPPQSAEHRIVPDRTDHNQGRAGCQLGAAVVR